MTAARAVAVELLARRPWTCAELTTRLRRRGAPGEVAATVVRDLTARGYLDDGAFARRWVEQRASRGYGAARLRNELRARGVAPSLVEAALAELGGETVTEAARAAARRRLPALSRAPARRVAARLRDHLMRRGFPASVVSRVIRETTGVQDDDRGDRGDG
ncbi:MAG: regulatory protein RecX [Candidatus Rokubacteria bacterium]|nr:regulatory protein RecX [Candidatus Rokubacteria bacterium]